MFTNEEVTVGYISHKTGPGHSDFSPPQPIILKPGKGLRWQKPIVVLANRRTYSAANAFVMYMKALPNVTFYGRPHGWRFGTSFLLRTSWRMEHPLFGKPIYNTKMEHTEFGIEPDIPVSITRKDYQRGVDTILEQARALLRKK